jgi:prepilin-type N-terminal cleavage/methylation domain-containing protein
MSHEERRSCGGFTLIEMLVTLVIVATITALLWQAMHQFMRVEQLLQRSGVDGQLDTVRREWLRGLIQASLAEQIGAPRQFQGDGQQLTVASAEVLDMPGLQASSLQIQLESDASSGRQRLLVVEAKAASLFRQGLRGDPQPIGLIAWQGRPGAIRYLDVGGQWHDQWPPQRSAAVMSADEDLVRLAQAAMPRLPRAVLLDLGAEVGGPLVVSMSVTDPGRPTLAQWE